MTIYSRYVFLYRAPCVAENLLTMNNLELFDKHMLVEGKKTIDKQDIECFKYWFCKPSKYFFNARLRSPLTTPLVNNLTEKHCSIARSCVEASKYLSAEFALITKTICRQHMSSQKA